MFYRKDKEWLPSTEKNELFEFLKTELLYKNKENRIDNVAFCSKTYYIDFKRLHLILVH